jgi:hypothetical protein
MTPVELRIIANMLNSTCNVIKDLQHIVNYCTDLVRVLGVSLRLRGGAES